MAYESSTPPTGVAKGATEDEHEDIINQVLPAFKLERYFARWEFKAPHLLCCSDCEPLTLNELLTLADPDSKHRWENLRLGYGETRGLPALCEEITSLYEHVRPEGVIVCAPQECIFLAMKAMLQPGDHVVVTFPGYQSLYQVAASLGCQVDLWEVDLGEDGGATFDVGKFTSLLRPKTKLAVVNFPHNPTGALLSPADWTRLVESCRNVGCYLFSDEIYRLMEFDPATRLPSAVDVYDKAITLSGMSKAYGLPGLRIGWLAVRPPCYPLLDRIAQLKDYTTICNSQPSEVLALMALRAREALLARSLTIVCSNLGAVQDFMQEFCHLFRYRPPIAGSVAFPRLAEGDAYSNGLESSGGAEGHPGANERPVQGIEAFCDQVVSGCGVLLLPGTVYDHAPSIARGHFRIGLGRRDLPECLQVLRNFLLQLEQKR